MCLLALKYSTFTWEITKYSTDLLLFADVNFMCDIFFLNGTCMQITQSCDLVKLL